MRLEVDGIVSSIDPEDRAWSQPMIEVYDDELHGGLAFMSCSQPLTEAEADRWVAGDDALHLDTWWGSRP